ncbi:hypothetical protein SteCoe_792 [Stentor coeruleus]|uniref:Calmodulin n=1 Tax=Stentor coeruleus TaxID=5963 RepID=A0A1R2D3D5_9CILI|nr:hypothetical protein SteCoe_792 [Stentor coeruleus]
MMYILLSGKPPFYGKKDQDIIKKVIAGEYSVTGNGWENVSSDAIRLLERMLELNPKRRISAKAALQDPWILNNIAKSRRVGSEKSKTLINLALFHTEQKLQHAVLTFIAANVVSKEMHKELLESFQKLDRNKDGKISAEELFHAYKEKMKKEDAFEEVKKIMETLDLNQSGFIDYSEFITACLKKELLINNDTMDIAFKTFDIDNSGKITINELKEVLGLIEIQDESVAKLIKKVDENGDGNIDINEFKNMMMQCMNYADDNVEIR